MKDNIQVKQLPTQQLEDMLHKELNKLQPDGELVRKLLSELESRSEPIDLDQPAVQKAAQRFQQNCAADEARQQMQRVHKYRKWILSTVAAAIALCVLLLVVPGTANAESAWERLARWTDTVFEFFSPGDVQEEYVYTTDHPGLQQVYDEVADLGVTRPVVPMWIPEEYELTYLDIVPQRKKIQVRAKFSYATSEIMFVFEVYNQDSTRKHLKDDQRVGIYENDGIIHYILSNDSTTTVTWIIENIECSIYVDVQEDVLYKILDSIYEMEDQ